MPRKRLAQMTDRESRATKALLVMRRFYVRDIHLPDGTKVVLVSRRPIKCRAHHHCTSLSTAAPARRRAKRRKKKK